MIIQGLVGIEKELINKDSLTKELIFKLDDHYFNRTVNVELWEEDDKYIYLPRFYVRSMMDLINVDNKTSYIPATIPFKWELDVHDKKDLQNIIVDNILADFKARAYQFEGGLITAPMGSGKTVISLKLAHKLGLKTLIIVHRGVLLWQWKNMISKFCGLPDSEIGMVQQEKWIYDKPITVAMLQTLLSDKFPEDFKTSFGLVIVDEVSHIAAPVWWQVVKRLWSRFTLGLTGTPKKGNELHRIFKYTIGMKEYGSSTIKLRGQVDFYKYTFYIPDFKLCITDDNQVFIPLFVNKIVRNKDFLKFVIGIIKKYMDQNRNILVTTDRVQHAKTIYAILQKMYPGKQCQLLIGGVKDIQYASCYVGTTQYISEGVDIPHLDTLVLTMPRYSVKQVVGRLLRNLKQKYIIIADIRHRVFPIYSCVDDLYYARFRTYNSWGLDIYYK